MNEINKIRNLEYPWTRWNIISVFQALANFENQKNTWVSAIGGRRFWDTLYMSVCGPLFEDMELDLQASEFIGEILYDEEEAEMIEEFCEYLLDLLIERIGDCQPDSAYIDHPEWPYVVSKSKEIYDHMIRNNEKYDYAGRCEEFDRELIEEKAREAKEKEAKEKESGSDPSSGES